MICESCHDPLPIKRQLAIEMFRLQPLCLSCAEYGVRPILADDVDPEQGRELMQSMRENSHASIR